MSKVRIHFVLQRRFSQLLSLLAISSLLSVSTPAATRTIVDATVRAAQDARFALVSSGFGERVPRMIAAFLMPGGERPSDRISAIAQIRIYPAGPITLRQGQEANLSAIAFDGQGEAIQGIGFQWTLTDLVRDQLVERPLLESTLKAAIPGSFVVKARAGGRVSAVPITVIPFSNPIPADATVHRIVSRTGQSTPVVNPNSVGSAKPDVRSRGIISETQLLPGDGWNDGNWPSAGDPGNQTGNSPGSPDDGGAGSGNFQISAPVLSLPGRGIDIDLKLYYNSRVWNKSGSELKFDIDRGAPAPGWSLGFGKIVFMGSQGGCMLIDADGTRRGYGGDVTAWDTGMSFEGLTADGSLTDYNCLFNYGNSGWGWAKFANGTSVTYSTIGATPDQIHPTQIVDAQGNYVTITYRNPENPQLETITDTMGRVVTFQYDSLNRLISITGPRSLEEEMIYGSARTRVAVRFHYKAWPLSYDFGPSITPVVRDGVPWVVDAIYYPATQTGYWFNDSDSYSTYGMITKVLEQRAMTWTPGPEAQGTVTRGVHTTREAHYNYPLSPTNDDPGRTSGVDLTDAPTYTKLTEDWAGSDDGSLITEYEVLEVDDYWENGGSSPARSVAIKIPATGIVNKQYTYRTPTWWMHGLPFVDRTFKTVNGNLVEIGRSKVSWLEGNSRLNYLTPRPAWTESMDENGHTIKTTYEYATGRMNQITRQCDLLNGSTLPARCKSIQYENSQPYIGSFNTGGKWVSGRHVFNLILSASVENPDGTRATLTEFEYDNYQAQPFQNAPGVIQHLHSHNAFSTATQDVPPCLQWGPYYECRMLMPPPGCRDCLVWSQGPVYDTATNKRGNVTKITTYADPQSMTGPVYETRGYDITGNLVKISSACCEETTISYEDPNTEGLDSYYTYPVSQTRGAADPNSPNRMTTFTRYGFHTGLIKSATDANGRTTTNWYHPDNLRPVKVDLPTGAYSTTFYDEPGITLTAEVHESDGTLAGKTKKYLNGVGQVKKIENYQAGNAVDIVEAKYTKFGEEWMTSRPYRAGDIVRWSEKFYDDQRRLIRIVRPDGSETNALYNEPWLPDSVAAQPGNRIRLIDAWGRERWGRYDQLGRLVEVVEPNPDAAANPTGSVYTAAGSLLTKYSYDTLGRLVETAQGARLNEPAAQFRKFEYDGLGRVTRQKLAEQSATLNDAGQYVGIGQAGANWSEAFWYDNRSNLTLKIDPRGVKTNFSYQLPGGGEDPLNRLHSRAFDMSGPLDTSSTIHAAPSVSYTYMTVGDKARISQIRTWGFLTEDYLYDSEGRVSEYKQTVDYRGGHPMTVNYLYDSLDRPKDIELPAQYGNGGGRKIVRYAFDQASRLTGVEYGTVIGFSDHASDLNFNASGQITSMNIGDPISNQITEEFTFDPQTGLLINQKAFRGTTSLLNLSYDYSRGSSVGSLNGKAGSVTKITDNLNNNKSKEYEYDALERLTKVKGGVNGSLWWQKYSYDRYGNRTNVQKDGVGIDSNPIPMDGLPNLTYDTASNRITSSGFQYDTAGNQISGFAEDGTPLLFEYDSANRVQIIKRTSDGALLQAFQYTSTNARLMDYDALVGRTKIFASVDGTTLAEYTEFQHTVPTWTKGFTYLGDSLLATLTPAGSGNENVEFNHPDRLTTRVITSPQTGGNSEQAHLPFGKALNSESTITNNNKRFTSYDRNVAITGLDYAINRTYDSKQGRFTQVDPIGMEAVSLSAPQTLNLYTYCGNDPVNRVDPSGLFWGWIKKFFSWIVNTIRSSKVVRRIVIKFVVSFVMSGGNLGVAVRSIVPDILASLGLTPPKFALTPAWDPDLPHPLAGGGVSSLNKYIIKNFRPGRFQTIRDIVLWFFGFINSISIQHDREYTAAICEKRNGELILGKILMGTRRNSPVPNCDEGRRVAIAHTHGAHDPTLVVDGIDKNEIFSPGDKQVYNDASILEGHLVLGYVATPRGQVKMFTPAVIANSDRGKSTTIIRR